MAVASVVNIREDRRVLHRDLNPEGSEDAAAEGLLAAFHGRLHVSSELEPTLASTLAHLKAHPGSMVRPHIVSRLAEAYGIEPGPATDLAIALEYFHTASLVFDDLPCMDNATMRRGAPCVHIAFGESSAILGALALINRAYALTWKALARCAPEVREPALEYLEQHLGTQGLLNGQSLDLNYSELPHTLDSTRRVAQGKTVSLIALTLVLPAMAGGATARELQLLDRISTSWGLSYQIVDDLKDVLESSSKSGKTASRDAYLGRPNTVLAIGIGGSVDRLLRLLRLGDRNLGVLIGMRPALGFLREFRETLEYELNRIIEHAGVIPINRIR